MFRTTKWELITDDSLGTLLVLLLVMLNYVLIYVVLLIPFL